MAKKKPGFQLPNLKSTLLTGAISVFIVGGLFVAIKQKAVEVLAAPDEIKQVKEDVRQDREQNKLVRDYVVHKIKEEDFNDMQKKAAPPGMRWDSDQRAYVKLK